MLISRLLKFILLAFIFSSCTSDVPNAIFRELGQNHTGIDFRNLLKEDENFNIFKYQYFNNGGGVAIGDFNNDGLQDIVFTGNMVKNRLYINQGNLRFEDVTQKSGIASKEGWCTGVTPVDINEDGWLDLYICRTGYPFDDLRSNLLFINNGDLTFTEQAADYGLDDPAFATHSSFFDYDLDGDLDLFLLNHSTVEYSRGSLEVFSLRSKKNPDFTNKLLRNDNGRFVNVTEEAGIYGNVLSFSLGISISDINDDGWPDIFVGNDFNEPDYLFINEGNGHFIESCASFFDHTAMFSMGSDIADFNNDGLVDIVSLDMLPQTNYQQKMHSGADNFDKVALLEKNGFFRQSSRNMLQLNNGDGSFSEIGQLAGVSNTNWSWAPLFFDFDNDGFKDLFVANGYPRDHTDMDFLNFTANEVVKINKGENPIDFDGYMAKMPPIILPNYFFQNQGDLKFENKTKDWGLDQANVSQSAAYVDLDNDGDLDLVLNNTNDYASLYENQTNSLLENHYLRIKIEGKKENSWGIGTKIYVYAGDQTYYQEQQPVRGFQSSVDPILHFGLGEIQRIDSIVVLSPDQQKQLLGDIAVDQELLININGQGEGQDLAKRQKKPSFFRSDPLLNLRHQESDFNDFKIQSLLPWSFSRQGPAIAVGDINGDNRQDFFFANSQDKTGQILIQNEQGQFLDQGLINFSGLPKSEYSDALFFDANGDDVPDLYLSSGSYEFREKDTRLKDRLFLNNGQGEFVEDQKALPEIMQNSSCVKAADVDQDGDMDLFVGGGYQYANYPLSHPSQLLINNGLGQFKNRPIEIGNVTDAAWVDLDQDGQVELVTVGEWENLKVFKFQKGVLEDHTSNYINQSLKGLWKSLHLADFDADGDIDIVAGNMGLNSQLSASAQEPLQLYAGDFDQNKSIDPLLFYYIQGESWPFASRDDLISQLPGLKRKFLHFKDYANAKVEDILSASQMEEARLFEVQTLSSFYFENEGGHLSPKALPKKAQFAPICAINSLDINQDGNRDLVLAGNMSHTKVKLGRLDGNHGLVLLGDGKGVFTAATASESGISVRGTTNTVKILEVAEKQYLLYGQNNDQLMSYQLQD